MSNHSPHTTPRLKVAVTILGLALTLASALRADVNIGSTTFSIGTTSGGENVLSNWLGTAFAINAPILVGTGSGGNSVTISNFTITANGTSYIGNNGNKSNLVTIQPDTTWTLGANTLFIGNGAGATGNVLTVSGGTITINANEVLFDNGGYLNGLVITNGGRFIVTGNARYAGFSSTSSYSNTITVTGSGSMWSNSLQMYDSNSSTLGGDSISVLDSGLLVSVQQLSVGFSANNENLTVSDTGSVVRTDGGIFVGGGSVVGSTLVVSNGAKLVQTAAAGIITIGDSGGAYGNGIVVTGPGSVLSNMGNFIYLGHTVGSNNTLQISNGGLVYNAGTASIGNNGARNAATITDSGSVWTNVNLMVVGHSGSSNSVTIANGGKVFAAGLTVGDVAGFLGNSVIATNNSGGFYMTTGALLVGAQSGAVGGGNNTVILSNSLLNGNAASYIGYGSSNNAVTILGNSVWNQGGQNLTIGNNASTGNVLTVGGGFVTNVSALTISTGSTGARGNQLIVTNGGVFVNSGNATIGDTTSGPSNSVTVTGVGSIWSNTGGIVIFRGGAAGGSSGITVANSGMVYVTSLYVGAASPSNTVLVTDPGSVFIANNVNEIGEGSGDPGNRLIVSNGAKFVTKTGGLNLNGSSGGFNNQVIVTGSGSVLSNTAGGISIGAGSLSTNNSVSVSDGAGLFSGAIVVGNGSGASNSYNVGGVGLLSTVSNGTISVGALSSTANNTLTITNATLLSSTGTIGSGSSSNTAYVLSNATWNLQAGTLVVGGGAATSNRLTVDAGVVTNAGQINIGSSGGTAGARADNNGLIITNGGKVYNTGNLHFGNTGATSGATDSNNFIIVTGAGSIFSNAFLFIGGQGGPSTNNSLTVADGAKMFGSTLEFCEFDRGFNNTVTVTDTGSVLRLTASVLLPTSTTASSNQLFIRNGGSVFVSTGVAVGGPSNMLTVVDPGSVLTNLSTLTVGGYSSGMLISNGGAVIMSGANAGQIGNSGFTNRVTVTGTGSIWSNGTAAVTVGNGGTYNSLTVANGGTVWSTGLTIGNTTGSSNNTVTIQDANYNFGGGELIVGSATGLTAAQGNHFTALGNTAGLTNLGGVNLYSSGDTLYLTNRNLAASSPSDATGQLNLGSPGLGGNALVLSNQDFMVHFNLGAPSVIGLSSSNNAVTLLANTIWRDQFPSGTLMIGTNAAVGNAVTLNGGVITNVETVTVGFGPGAINSGNSLVVTNGGQLAVRTSIVVGAGGSSSNSLVIDGGSQASPSSTIVTNTPGTVMPVIVGNAGSGYNTMTITNATLMSNAGTIGFGGSNNTVNVLTGGVWNLQNAGKLEIGSDSGNANSNLLLVSGGLVTNFGSAVGLVVGGNGVNFDNRLVISNGGKVFGISGSSGFGVRIGGGGDRNQILLVGAGAGLKSGSGLVVGDGSGGSNSLMVSNGATVTLDGNISIGGGAGPKNSVIIDGNGSAVTTSGEIDMQNGGASNSLIISHGGNLISGDNLRMGNGTGGSNTVLVTDNGSSWTTTIPSGHGIGFDVGGASAGNQLIVSNGGVVSVSAPSALSYIGGNGGASDTAATTSNTVTVTGDGSLWTNNTGLVVGRAGGRNALSVLNSGKVFAVSATIGSSGGTNTVLVSDPASVWNLNGGGLFIGSNVNSVANQLIVSNHASLFSGATVIGNASGANSNVATITDGGQWNVGGQSITIGVSGATGNTLTLGNNAVISNVAGILIGAAGSTDSRLYINGGILRPGAAGNLLSGSGSAYVQAGGATIDTLGFSVSNTIGLLGDPSSTGGGLTKTGAGTLTLAAINTYSGPTIINQGAVVLATTFVVSNSTVTPNVNGGLLFSNATAFTVGGLAGTGNVGLTNTDGSGVALAVGNNGQNSSYSGALSGSGSLTKTGTGVFQLTGNSTFSGPTIINQGAVVLAASFAVSNSTVTANANDALLFSNATAFTVGGLAGTGNIGLTNTDGSGIGLTVGNNGQNSTYSGVLSGSGSLTKTGAGTLVLSGPNTYGGDTTINQGALVLGNSTASGNGPVIVNVAGGLAFSNQTSFIVAGLSGSGDVGLTNTLGAGVGLEINSALSNSYSGILSGSGSLTKSGGGVLQLTGHNTFNGTIGVNAGELLVNGSLAGGGALTLSANTLLGGTGTIGRVIGGGGTVAPGNSPGILTVNQLNPSAELGLSFEFGQLGSPDYTQAGASGNDVLRITNATPFTVALGLTNGVNLYVTATLAPGTVNLLRGGFYTDDSAAFDSLISGATYNLYVNGVAAPGRLVFVHTVDEPGTQFGGINGRVMELGVMGEMVPEPQVLMFWLAGAVTMYAARKRLRRA